MPLLRPLDQAPTRTLGSCLLTLCSALCLVGCARSTPHGGATYRIQPAAPHRSDLDTRCVSKKVYVKPALQGDDAPQLPTLQTVPVPDSAPNEDVLVPTD